VGEKGREKGREKAVAVGLKFDSMVHHNGPTTMLRRLLAGVAIAAFVWRGVAAMPSPQAGSPGGGGNSTTYIVAVGKADHKFTPDVIIAKPGDTICEYLSLFYQRGKRNNGVYDRWS